MTNQKSDQNSNSISDKYFANVEGFHKEQLLRIRDFLRLEFKHRCDFQIDYLRSIGCPPSIIENLLSFADGTAIKEKTNTNAVDRMTLFVKDIVDMQGFDGVGLTDDFDKSIMNGDHDYYLKTLANSKGE